MKRADHIRKASNGNININREFSFSVSFRRLGAPPPLSLFFLFFQSAAPHPLRAAHQTPPRYPSHPGHDTARHVQRRTQVGGMSSVPETKTNKRCETKTSFFPEVVRLELTLKTRRKKKFTTLLLPAVFGLRVWSLPIAT